MIIYFLYSRTGVYVMPAMVDVSSWEKWQNRIISTNRNGFALASQPDTLIVEPLMNSFETFYPFCHRKMCFMPSDQGYCWEVCLRDVRDSAAADDAGVDDGCGVLPPSLLSVRNPSRSRNEHGPGIRQAAMHVKNENSKRQPKGSATNKADHPILPLFNKRKLEKKIDFTPFYIREK